VALIGMRDIRLSFGGAPLLDDIALQVEKGERIGLVGRNGEGKSTLMKLLNGDINPDSGDIARSDGLQTALLPQDIPAELDGTVFAIVAQGQGENGRDLARYRRLLQAGDAEAQKLQRRLDQSGGWDIQPAIDSAISRTRLDPDVEFNTLSGGLKRRVLLARALAGEPDLLFLDEPTNHLDIDAIDWLEDFLPRLRSTLFFVTHDRIFLTKIANRIIELDRGRLSSWDCGYDTFLRRKRELLETEEKERANFDRKIAAEEIRARQSISARRTRNEGRARALDQMRHDRRQWRLQPGKARIRVQEAERSGNLVIEAKGITYAYGEEPVVRDFSATMLRGDKIGLIGPNGAGKTTLLRLLLGQLEPQAGSVRHGTRLEVAYFDQMRQQLDQDKTVAQNVADGLDTVTVNGKSQHIMSYLRDFLFTQERAHTPVWVLSGGERNRLLLARLFAQPCNLLVLDEPTNDLDAETLELLEELLVDFSGTLLVVSHDRALLNNVATSVFAFEDKATVKEYVGGYDDWVRQRPPQAVDPASSAKPAAKVQPRPQRARRLSYKEKRELEELPGRIESLESEQAQLQQALADPALYQGDNGTEIGRIQQRLEEIEPELESSYSRWTQLEEVEG
jgi:ABC transport system ATP-binding/permease protein